MEVRTRDRRKPRLAVVLAALFLAACGDRESAGEPRLPEAPGRGAPTAQEGLAFFNALSGLLRIELTEPAEPVAPGMANRRATETATIHTLRLEMQVMEGEASRPLTEEEWSRIVVREPTIRLVSDAKVVVAHDAPNGAFFTVRDLTAAVEETERRTRGQTEWFGGIDVHHVFFEGIDQREDGVWTVAWGS